MKLRVVVSGLTIVLGASMPFGDVREAIAADRTLIVTQAPVDARKVEAHKLLRQGNQQYKVSQFEAAFQSYQQALKGCLSRC